MKKNFEIENAKLEQSFTSTGDKLLHHKDAVGKLRNKKNHPIVLHIMPTEICNLKCIFCSVAQRGEKGRLFCDLTLGQIKSVTAVFKSMGLKAVILSGGGEPALYKHINELLEYLKCEGLQIGMISNGISLAKHIKQRNIESLSWIRISANSFDYVDEIEIPRLNKKTILGFSYIWNPLTSDKTLNKIKDKIKERAAKNPVAYVRMLPDCNLETSELEKAHRRLRAITRKLGFPFFHQYKTHKTPKECHLGRVHPVFYTDGYIYPCDSLVLNSPLDNKKFHRDFALCRWNEAERFFSKKIDGSLIDTKKCHHCVFARQNKLLMTIINTKDKLPNPISGLKHKNFI
jgi:radical SAM protein with 4Fe4S-binding SPASM domain